MRKKIILVCTICGSRNYTTNKNESARPERFETRKFCRTCVKHTLHRETK